MKLSDFSGVRLLVVGDVMLDKYWFGNVDRISPEAPVPIVHIKKEVLRMGGAGNVALNASALGARVQLLGLVGSDTAADQIEHLLKTHCVQSRVRYVVGGTTTTKIRVMSQGRQLIRLDIEDDFTKWDADLILADYTDKLGQVDGIILSDYAKGTLRYSEELIKRAVAAGKPVIVDPKGKDFSRYRGATLITPNLSEFESVVGRCDSEPELEARGCLLRDSLELEAILITRSEKGMTLLLRGELPLHLPARAQEVFDVTGAGDTVVATLGVALSSGFPLSEAAELANYAAGTVVTKIGTSTVSLQELQRVMLHPETEVFQGGIVDEKTLQMGISAARSAGKRIVMTNGCFDILHPGHIDYLEKARALGDRLIVAINDDASVTRIKGAGRPINPLATRMRMLAALECVDWVISFSEDTPKRLYCLLLPDILVKGGDYREEEVVGGDCVTAAGGKVQIVNYLSGFSTTEFINRIRGWQT
jgi:D-beta-D-heptose 7-phosphate kinase/D-beta-D-heptose 1-phosphate adenosyltransferase